MIYKGEVYLGACFWRLVVRGRDLTSLWLLVRLVLHLNTGHKGTRHQAWLTCSIHSHRVTNPAGVRSPLITSGVVSIPLECHEFSHDPNVCSRCISAVIARTKPHEVWREQTTSKPQQKAKAIGRH